MHYPRMQTALNKALDAHVADIISLPIRAVFRNGRIYRCIANPARRPAHLRYRRLFNLFFRTHKSS